MWVLLVTFLSGGGNIEGVTAGYFRVFATEAGCRAMEKQYKVENEAVLHIYVDRPVVIARCEKLT